MNKHCKGCDFHHSAGRRHPDKREAKFNDWCCKRGGPVLVGWCKTHNAKQTNPSTSQGTEPTTERN